MTWTLSHLVLGEEVRSFRASSLPAAGEDLRRLVDDFDETLDWSG